ncbi:DNA pilot protein [Dipodfec virus UOA04_Rod_582]|nr:DNA pilot protein [Dipodfec virus UOA04_Rod_582]
MGSWIEGISGAVGGLLGSIGSAISQSKSIKFQREENALNRQFNHDEAQLSRDFTESMWNAQNHYNDPSQVVSRLKAAGLNPALAYGGFSDAASVSGGSAASSSGSISPPALDSSGIVSAGNSFVNAKLADAQAKLADMEARKIGAEIPWIDSLNESIVQLQNTTSGLNLSQIERNKNMNENDGKRLEAELKSLQAQVDKTLQEVRVAAATADNLEIRNKYAELKEINEVQQGIAIIQRTFADAKLSEQQAFDLACTLSSRINLMDAETGKLNADANSINFDLDVKKMVGAIPLARNQSLALEAELEALQGDAAVRKWQGEHAGFTQWTTILGGLSSIFVGAASAATGAYNARTNRMKVK